MKKILSVFLCVIVLFLLGSVVCFATPASYSLFAENYGDFDLDDGQFFTTVYDYNSSQYIGSADYLAVLQNAYLNDVDSVETKVSRVFICFQWHDGDPISRFNDCSFVYVGRFTNWMQYRILNTDSFFGFSNDGLLYYSNSWGVLGTPVEHFSIALTNESVLSSSSSRCFTVPFYDPWDFPTFELSVGQYEAGFSDGYSEGRLDGQADPAANRLIDVLKAVIEAPFFLISKVFDVNIFGINIAGVIFSLLSIMIAYFVIKFILKVVK